jgi:uncharacterized repeat protein (TIGR01451 family)
MTIARHVKHASLALIALSSFGVLQGAYASGTPSGTTINNQATVDYSVGGVNQTQITSAVASFQVDTRIDFTVSEEGASLTLTTPGVLNVVTTFRVTNTGNSTQGYLLSADNEANGIEPPGGWGEPDNQNVSNIRWFVDNGDGLYGAGDTATNINSLTMDGTGVLVFVVADIPLAAANNQYATVHLSAQATAVGSTTPLTETPGADTAGVEIVLADDARDNLESALDQYAIRSAALTLNKTATVISDEFGSTNPKAIPGAVIEYEIVVTNNSTTTVANAVTVSDNIPANTSFVPGSITLNAGALPDTGNFLAGPPARVVVSAGAVAANGGAATVRFRVMIND